MEVGQGNVQALHAAGDAVDERALWKRFRDATTPEAFAAGWLAIQCQMIEGVEAGLVLTRNESSEAFEPAAHWPEGQRPGRHLATAAEKALQEGRALALQLDPQGERPDGAKARTVIAQVIESGDELAGVVVLDVAPRPGPELERALRRLAWGIPWLELSLQKDSRVAGRGAKLDALLDIIASPLEHERFRAAASAFVTELAMRFACERVSVGFAERGRVRLRSVSHSAQFSERANLSRAVEAAMDEALDQECSVLWPGVAEELPQVTRCHEELAAEGGSGAILSIPIAHGARLVGVVTLERRAEAPFLGSEQQLIEAAIDLAGPMLDIQRRDDRFIGTKMIDAARDGAAKLVGPRHVAAKLITIALVAVVLFMVFAKGDYRVVSDFEIEARVMRAAVAPFDGYIAEAPARAGDRVLAGALLARLDDRELVLEQVRWSSQVAQLTKEHRQAMAERNAAKAKILTAQLDQARAQLHLADAQLAKTRVEAAFDGMVVTGDLSQRLDSPVQRGDLLFEVAPLDEFRVAVLVDEREVDEIEVGQGGELVFSAFPDHSYELTVTKITPVAEAKEGSNTFRIEAQLDEVPERLLPGMEGIAKIEVDRRPLIWIWTHEIIDWVRLTLWRWMP